MPLFAPPRRGLALLALLCPLAAGVVSAQPVESPPSLDRQRESLVAALLDEALAQPHEPEETPSRLSERLAAARSLLAEEQPLSAAVLLLRDPPDSHPPAESAAEWQRLAVQSLLASELPTRASRLLLSLPARQPQSQQLYVELAARWLQRGEAHAALAALSSEPPTVAALRMRWVDLGGRALLALQRPLEAAQRYAAFFDADPFQLLAWTGDDPLQLHSLRYNWAVALMRAGASTEAVQQLDQLGQIDPARLPTSALRALRDRANLLLGEQLLGDGKAAAAREAYRRVRIEGPYSAQALLGLGWANLAPSGSAQPRPRASTRAFDAPTPDVVLRTLWRRGVIDCALYNRRVPGKPVPCLQGTQLAQQQAPARDDQHHQPSLEAWQLLIDRHPTSLAGREARLALATVQARRGKASDAAQQLERLAAELASERAALHSEKGLQSAATDEQSLIQPAQFGLLLPRRSALREAALPVSRWWTLLQDESLQGALRQARQLQEWVPRARDPALQTALQDLASRYEDAAAAELDRQRLAEADTLRRMQQAALKAAIALRDPGERPDKSSSPP